MSFIIGTPHTKNAGYYMNNQELGSKREQADVQTCTHCQRVLLMDRWKEDGGWCGRCMAPICIYCADRMPTFGCEPFMKKIDEYCDSVAKVATYHTQAVRELPAPSPALILPGKES